MNFYKALKIMGLFSDYTEDILRKKYYALARQYHPDALINKTEAEKKEASEKLKEINLAYEVLSKALKEGKTNSNNSSSTNGAYSNANDVELLMYMKKIISIVGEYLIPSEAAIFNDFPGLESVIDVYNDTVKFYLGQINTATSIDEIDVIFLEFKNKIASWYEQFKNSFLTNHPMGENTNFEISADEPFGKFYTKLKSRYHAYCNYTIRRRCIEKLKSL